MLLIEGQVSGSKSAALLVDALKAKTILADKGYDADWFREELDYSLHSIPCQMQNSAPHDVRLYRQHHKIENMFGRSKDWRRIATRYDRFAHTLFSAICIDATVIS